MELNFLYTLLASILLTLTFLQLLHLRQPAVSGELPPGTMGWPFIGETLAFLSAGWKGHPQRFIFDRVSRFNSDVFKTSILMENVAVVCGPLGHKLLFSGEDKIVTSWWPDSVNKIFPSSLQTDSKQEAKNLRSMLPRFLKPDALRRYVAVMDAIARRHPADAWDNRREVTVFPLAKNYTFLVACKVFLSLEDPTLIARFADPFNLLPFDSGAGNSWSITAGIISLPVDLPGTAFNRAIKAARFIRKELQEVIGRRRADLANNKASPTQDILSHMITTPIDETNFMSDEDIADKILGLLIGGHDTTGAAITFIIKYLAELPHVYEKVYEEQMEIAKSRKEGEMLTWTDIQKMKYSWNVACEVMRLAPPVQGAFREALHDFTFHGFKIPKGWKLYWSTNSTHLNPAYFPEPERFDPSRFEGNGPEPYTYVPFGGGPRQCPGKEYARLETLVFMHNMVTRFKWEKLIADEKIIVDPFPILEKGLPIRVIPHTE